MQNLYENFLHKNFYMHQTRSVIHVSHIKIFFQEKIYHEIHMHEIFLRENTTNYGIMIRFGTIYCKCFR